MMRELKPLRSIRPPPLRSLRSLLPEKKPTPGAIEEYHEAACNAIGVPHKPEGKIYHHVGYFMAADTHETLDAIVSVYQRNMRVYFYDYTDYLHALENAREIRRTIEQYDKFVVEEEEREAEHELRWREWINKESDKRGQEPYMRRKAPPVAPTKEEREFAEVYDRRCTTPDPKGYFYYAQHYASDLLDIAVSPIPLLIEVNKSKPHGYVLGATRSGKSELLKSLVHTYVKERNTGAVVVIEPSGKMVREIAQWKEFNTGNRLVYIKPTLLEDHCPSMNPFEIPNVAATDYSKKALHIKRVIAQELTKALVRIVSDTGNYFSPNMEQILENCVLVLLDKEGSTLEDLSDFMIAEKGEHLIDFARGLKHHKFCETYWGKDGFNAPGRVQTKQAIYSRLGGLLNTGTFREFTCNKSTVKLQEALDKGKVLLFDVSKGGVGEKESRAIGMLILAMILGIANRRSEVDGRSVPCAIVVDECHNFMTQTMEDILFETGKYEIQLVLSQQAAGQRMPVEIKDAVLSSANLQIIGGTPLSGAKRNADLLGITAEEVRTLKQGEFYVRPHRTQGVVKFQGRTDLLDTTNSVSKHRWRAMLKEQARKYYGKAEEVEIVESDEDDYDFRPQPYS